MQPPSLPQAQKYMMETFFVSVAKARELPAQPTTARAGGFSPPPVGAWQKGYPTLDLAVKVKRRSVALPAGKAGPSLRDRSRLPALIARPRSHNSGDGKVGLASPSKGEARPHRCVGRDGKVSPCGFGGGRSANQGEQPSPTIAPTTAGPSRRSPSSWLFLSMSAIGASCAHVYVMKKRQEEKLKNMEEGGEKSVVEDKAKKMSLGNYIVTALKATNVTHSCVGNLTEFNLIIA
ncbi:hypothetical protein NL676_019746 [Syzygium grande]|nr:hypothetical protein NL676_019746 [Syzygium grande]